MLKVVGPPIFELTEIDPLCSCIICLDQLSPMPEPSDLVVKKGIKILSKASGIMPCPLSVTSMMTWWS